jgi:hypothetical protein
MFTKFEEQFENIVSISCLNLSLLCHRVRSVDPGEHIHDYLYEYDDGQRSADHQSARRTGALGSEIRGRKLPHKTWRNMPIVTRICVWIRIIMSNAFHHVSRKIRKFLVSTTPIFFSRPYHFSSDLRARRHPGLHGRRQSGALDVGELSLFLLGRQWQSVVGV